MGQLEDVRTFVEIVDQGSIGKAAEQAGIAKSAVSRKLRLLEERMQAVLIARTTRQWSLTEAGREYYERGLAIIAAFDEFEAHVRNDNVDLRGDIKLSVPLYFGKVGLSAHLLEFAKQNPAVQLNIDFNDRMVDVINEHFDLVVRISEMRDSSLIARPLCETRHICCASPEYIKSHGHIHKPEDLKGHSIIQFGSTKRPTWTFHASSGKTTDVKLSATLNSHDGAFLIEAAEHALGIIRVPDFLAKPSLDSRRLVQLLTPYAQQPRGIFIVYPSSRYLPQRTRALMEHLLAQYK